jgi:uncharacterized protein (TIGR03437 family)
VVSSYRCVLLFLLGKACAPAAEYVIQTVAGTDDVANSASALSAALSQPEGIAVDSSGNVYFADAALHQIRKISADGSIQTIAGTGVSGFAGDGGPASQALLNQPYGLALDPAGNLYIADLGNARVRKITVAGAIQTVAGGGTLPATSTGQGGPATTAQLTQPRDIAIGADGSLYISDFGASQVYEVATNGILSLVAGTGTAGFAGAGSSALLAQLNAPAGLVVDPSGALYIADSGNGCIRKMFNGDLITAFNTPAPTGLALDSNGILYIAAASYFGTVVQPIPGIASARDVALDAAGNVYVTSGALVLKIPSTGVVTTIAGSGASPYFGGDGGPATAAQLYSPSGIVVDSGGNWYIADTSNNRIRMVTPAGVISTFAGTGDPALLSAPRGIAIDGSNNLYVADSGNNAVREISPAGIITSIASQLNNPLSVAVDTHGSVYIADSGNNRILQVTAGGTSSTFAKITGPLAVAVDASGNVVAADASQIWEIPSSGTASSLIGGLTSPGALAFAPDGTLLIADTGANLIRQLGTSGLLSTLAGTGTAGFSGDGTSALAAELNAPAGIAIGANGTLLIADSANNRIRIMTPVSVVPDTGTITVENAASLATGSIAPGEIITVFGDGFDPTNTQLLFNGKPTTSFYTGATQINALAPANLPSNSSATISIVVDGAPIAASSVPVVSAAPGIFTTAGGTGQAAATNQDGSLNSESNPAARGSVVSLYATGQGSSQSVSLTIAGYTAPLLYAGPAPGFNGLMQINAQIPCGFLPPGIQAVVLSIDGLSSQSGVTLSLDTLCTGGAY